LISIGSLSTFSSLFRLHLVPIVLQTSNDTNPFFILRSSMSSDCKVGDNLGSPV
jgi:hypothetical protein